MPAEPVTFIVEDSAGTWIGPKVYASYSGAATRAKHAARKAERHGLPDRFYVVGSRGSVLKKRVALVSPRGVEVFGSV